MNDEPILQQPMHPPTYERRTQLPCAEHDRRISLTEQAVMSLKATNEGITTKMDLLLAQMTKVALLEERNVTQQIDLTRAHTKIEAQAKHLEELSRESRDFMAYSRGFHKVLWVVCGALSGLFIKVIFFAASNGMTP